MYNLRQLAEGLYENGMRCNCDYDNWQPENSTGHTHVCRIHKLVIAAEYRPHDVTDEGRAMIDAAMSTTNKGESK